MPAELVLTLRDLGHFLDFMGELQSALRTDNSAFRGLPPSRLNRIASILDDTREVCQQLEQQLEPCRPAAGASLTRKAWRAIVSVKIESDIIKTCDRLERLQQDLNRELQNCGLALLSSVK